MLSFNFSPFPVLETNRLLLKQIGPHDAEALFLLRSNEEVMKFLERPVAQEKEEVLAMINGITEALENNNAITWGLFTKEKPDVLQGTLGFWKIQKDHYRAELGYLLHPELQGKGIMSEALSSVLTFGFEIMKLHSIEANVNPQNLPSVRLLVRNGFVRKAYFKENYFYNGRFLDSAVYSFLSPFNA